MTVLVRWRERGDIRSEIDIPVRVRGHRLAVHDSLDRVPETLDDTDLDALTDRILMRLLP